MSTRSLSRRALLATLSAGALVLSSQLSACSSFGGHRPTRGHEIMPVPLPPDLPMSEPEPGMAPEPEGGLPSTALAPVDQPIVVRLTTVHFAVDRASLTPVARQKLRGAADSLKTNQHLVVEVVGYADSRGTEDYNQRLSERRAVTVRDYLVALGVGRNRIEARGMGEREPVATNETAEGRARNRRVDVNGRAPQE